MKIIDENKLNEVVSDIENYIAKNYKPTDREYAMILDELRKRYMERASKKNVAKKLGSINFKDIIKRARGEEE